MIWHKTLLRKLEESGLFREVNLVGAKVRARVNATRFLDVHYDPTTGSYSYAFIDLNLPSPGDKRLFGWDDYPHEGVSEIKQLESFRITFTADKRTEAGSWKLRLCAVILLTKLIRSLPWCRTIFRYDLFLSHFPFISFPNPTELQYAQADFATITRD